MDASVGGWALAPHDENLKPADRLPAGNLRGLAAVIASIAAVAIIYAIAAPLISLNLERHGVSSWLNGVMGATPSIAVMAVGVFIPHVVRYLGAVRCIYLGTGLSVAALILFPLIDNLVVWFALRFVMGASIGLIWIISETWVNGLAPDHKRGRIMGIYVAVLSAGSATGPLLVKFIGSAGSLPFLVSAAVLTLAILPIPFASRNGGVPVFHHSAAMPLRRAFLRAPIPMLIAPLHAGIWLSMVTLLPIYVVRAGSPEGDGLQIITTITIGGMVSQIWIGQMLDKWSARRVLMLAGLTQTLFIVALPFVLQQSMLLWPLTLLAGTFGSGIYTTALTLLGREFSVEELPSANTAFTMMWEVGALAGPILGGLAMWIWNPHGMLTVSAVGGMLLMYLGTRILAKDRHPLSGTATSSQSKV